MLSVLYILFISALFVLTNRYAPRAKVEKQEFVQGMVCVGIFLTGAMIGWFTPSSLHDKFGWDLGPGWLTRLAQLVGAVGGFLIAMRGIVIIGGVLILGIIGAVILSVVAYIVG